MNSALHLVSCLLVLTPCFYNCTPRVPPQAAAVPSATPSIVLALDELDSPAEADESRLQCTIVDLDDGEPMSSTVVILTKTSVRTTFAGITDENGFFEKKLPPGVYDVEVRYTGKNTFQKAGLSIGQGKTCRLKIGMASSRRL